MFPFAQHVVTGTALSILMAGAAPAQTAPAQTAPVWNSFFSPAAIAGGLVRGIVSYARVVVDIRYGALEVDAQRGGLTMRDLQISGLGKHERCRISLGRVQVSGISLWGTETSRMHIDLADLAIATNCFGPNAAMIGMVTGGDTIPLDALNIDVTQVSGSGALRADLEAISPGIARIEASADFDYVSLFSPDFFEKLAANQAEEQAFDRPPLTFDEDGNLIPPEDPQSLAPSNEPDFGLHGTLRAAHISAEDLGIWQRLQPLLPPDMTSAQTLQSLVTAPAGSPLHDFQRELAGVLAAFIAKPGRITAEIRPPAPVAFDTTGWAGPDDALAAFPLRLGNALPTAPVALIADPAAGSDNRALGLALAEGRGVPRSSRRAIALLTPLADDAEVALTLAGLIAPTDPGAAYAHALNAAGLGAAGAPAMLDRIEAGMPTAALLAAQAPADTALPEAVFASTVTLRDAALAHEQGDGAARSYALAWRLASAAAAAGDGPARALMARLETRFGADPAWITARDAAADQAAADWTGQDLAKRLAGGTTL